MQIPGLVNVDFADVRAIMANAGSSLMGIGTATGNIQLSYLKVFDFFQRLFSRRIVKVLKTRVTQKVKS